jgi:hypothetical protein
MERIDARFEPGGCDDPNVSGRLELPAKVVAECDQVDEMVGMKMADQDRVERARLDLCSQPRERALPKVEHDRGGSRSQEVGRAGGTRPICVCGSGAQDVELQHSRWVGGHRRSLAHPDG